MMEKIDWNQVTKGVQNIVQNLQVSSVWLLRPRRHINVRRTKFQYCTYPVLKKFDSSVCLLQAWGNDKMHWLIAVDGDIVVFHNHFISLYSNIYCVHIHIQYDMHGCYIHYTNHGICQTWETIKGTASRDCPVSTTTLTGTVSRDFPLRFILLKRLYQGPI